MHGGTLLTRVMSAGPGTPGTLGYGRRLRLFFLSMMLAPPVVIGIGGLISPPRDHGNMIAFVLLLLFFPAIAVWGVIETWGVSYRFDEEGIHVRSPWSRRRTLEWSEITRLRWRSTAKWLDFSDGGCVAHVTPLFAGLDGFARTCLQQLPPDVVAADAEAAAVLELMKNGGAGELVWANVGPRELLDVHVQ